MTAPRISLADLNDIPQLASNNGAGRDSWLPLNLAELPEEPPAPPTLGGFGIVYKGKRHVFSGPPESAKTIAAYAIGLETLRAHPESQIAVIDFEMGKRTARTRLRELGATQDELAHILYYEPEVPADVDRICLIVALNPLLVIIDAAAGAYAAQGLNDNDRGDVERFTTLYIDYFFHAEIATLVLDHVVKNTENRGKFAIGSERKTGGVDVHLGFDTILPIKRGSHGLYKITTHKDRDGWHQRGRLADLYLESQTNTHNITWEWRQHEPLEEGEVWRPTIYMERVSRYLETETEPCSRNHLEKNVEGETERIREAAGHLVELGYATYSRGPRHSHLYTHQHTFTISEWEKEHPTTTSPNLASTSPEAKSPPPRLLASPPSGGASERERGEATKNKTTSPDDPEVTAMLEQYGLTDTADDGIPF